MNLLREEIIKKYGVHNVLKKMDEECAEYLESREKSELTDEVISEIADVYNMALTMDIATKGEVKKIANLKMDRMKIRMEADWYDDDGQKKRK